MDAQVNGTEGAGHFHLATTSPHITYNGTDYDLGAYPPASIHHIILKGFQGLLGNEVASYVSEAKKKHKEEHGAEADEAQVNAWKAEFTTRAHDRLLKGDFTNVRGPRGTKLETLMTQYAVAEITARLKVANLSMPGKKGETVKFPDGSELSREALIERMLAKKGEVFKVRAQKEMDRLEDEAKRAAHRAGDGAVFGAEALFA